VKTILNKQQLQLTLLRLAHQLVENHISLDNIVFIGLQPRGIKVSEQIVACIANLFVGTSIQYGLLDITFYRDDVRSELHLANATNIPFSIEGKQVILIDDVLYTGRTIRAALDALQDFGRPKKVELCVLVDRRFNRELPIQPDYFGKAIDTLTSQKVKVEWDKEEVILYQ
jgi:pyrimidine operon attenuation protein / uracil phosphoribosyltransferase